MKYFLLFLIATSVSAIDCTHDKQVFRCVKYVKNYDADTVTFDIPNVHSLIGEKIPVRVYGIDSPEIKGKTDCEKDAAKKARDLVREKLINAKIINLKNIKRDKYFRILADVEYDGRDLKEDILKAGLAYKYYGETKEKRNWCIMAK